MSKQRLTSRAAPWLFVGFGVMVTLSGAQLYVQELASGRSASFGAIFLANFVASLPWLPLSFFVLTLGARYSPTRLTGFVALAAAGIALSVAFLSWLALFHLVVSGGPWTARMYLAWLRLDLGEFFTVSLLVYWLLVAAGLAIRKASAADGRRSRAGGEPTDAAATTGSTPAPPPLVIRSLGRSQLVDPAAIDWIEAEGSYVRLHVGSRSYLMRDSLQNLAESLGQAGFARIHRSTVVNLARVVEVKSRSHGDALVVLATGGELKVSRTFRTALARLGV